MEYRYLTRVAESPTGSRCRRPAPREEPRAPVAEPARHRRFGRSRSERSMRTSNRPLTGPAPSMTSPLNRCSPTGSSRSQPGMIPASRSGSSRTSQIASGVASTSIRPSPSMPGLPPSAPANAAPAPRANPAPSGGGGSAPLIQPSTFDGSRGSRTSSTPSASATAFAMHTGVVYWLLSPTPLAPSRVQGEGVGVGCTSTSSGTSQAVGTRYSAKVPDRKLPSSP